MVEQLATALELEPVAAEPPDAPAHLVKLDDEWALWRWVAIRGAGFPVDGVLKLAAPRTAAAADAILKAQTPHTSESLNTDFRETFKSEAASISRTIREVARSKDFREAVLWQNRHALHGSIAALLGMSEDRDVAVRDRRRREEVVASYLQRYCAKNDTIGFFGPVGWAEVSTTGDAIEARPGKTILAERDVYFEMWCIDELANSLAADGKLREWLAPRRTSYIDLVGTQLFLPARAPINLPIEQAAALRACDGQRTAREVARSLIANPLTGIKTQADAFKLLEGLEQRGLIVWKLDLPIELYPERSLRRHLERIEDESLKQNALTTLNEIEDARDRIAQAAGDEQALDAGMATLEEAFTRSTGSASTRSAGMMYAGRTLVYEDCRRDLELTIGPEVTAALTPPLRLLLTSGRWLTYHIARIAQGWFDKLFLEISTRTRSRVVDFTTLWYQLSPLLFDDRKPALAELMLTVQEKWDEILALPEGVNRVNFTSEELSRRVNDIFAVPASRFKSLLYHSPDLMIAAESVDAIRRGDYLFVMGELHATVNTIGTAVFAAHHPLPGELARNFSLDHEKPRGIPLIPKTHWPAKSSRLLPILFSSRDFLIEFLPEPANVPQTQVVPFGSLVVEDTGKGRVIRSRDKKLQFDPLDILTVVPSLSVGNDFKMLAPAKYRPRITIDRLVINRETWAFAPDEIAFVREKDEASRFLAARRWARDHGIPRFAFVKSPIETKPVYVDFDSPIYLNLLTKMVRKAKEAKSADLVVSEMLPLPHECWLPDANGQRYASELRMVAVDVG